MQLRGVRQDRACVLARCVRIGMVDGSEARSNTNASVTSTCSVMGVRAVSVLRLNARICCTRSLARLPP